MQKFFTSIGLFFIAALMAGLFGIFHDQISFSVSPEYFTRFKFEQFHIPAALPFRAGAALVGFQATWWMAFPIFLFVIVPSFFFSTPKQQFSFTVRALGRLLAVTSVFSIGGLLLGILCTREFDVNAYSSWQLPSNLLNARDFVRAGWMHNASYLGAGVGMIATCYSQIMAIRKLRHSLS